MTINPYYVYALIDPRDGRQFYIGKGKGKRRFHHVKDVLSGRICNSKKSARIREIMEAGLEVGTRLLADGLLEIDAIELEKVEIASQRETLTNIAPHGVGQSKEAREAAIVEWARNRLSQIVPYADWCSMRNQTDFKREMYWKIIRELKAIIVDPYRCAKEIHIRDDGSVSMFL